MMPAFGSVVPIWADVIEKKPEGCSKQRREGGPSLKSGKSTRSAGWETGQEGAIT